MGVHYTCDRCGNKIADHEPRVNMSTQNSSKYWAKIACSYCGENVKQFMEQSRFSSVSTELLNMVAKAADKSIEDTDYRKMLVAILGKEGYIT